MHKQHKTTRWPRLVNIPVAAILLLVPALIVSSFFSAIAFPDQAAALSKKECFDEFHDKELQGNVISMAVVIERYGCKDYCSAEVIRGSSTFVKTSCESLVAEFGGGGSAGGGGGGGSAGGGGGGGSGSTSGDAADGEEDELASTCLIEHGFAWLLCPAMNTLASINDGAFYLLSKMLVSPPMMSNSDSPAYQAWKMVRNIANVAFIILVMIVVMSQVTGIGLSNYGVKKMLPKLIIGAILVNASYIIVALMIDLSNVIGTNIYTISDGLVGGALSIDPSTGEQTGVDLGGWSHVITLVLAGGATIGGLMIASVFGLGVLGVLLPLLLGALIFVGGIVMVLVFRNALVIILAILSPLALVAYIFPNTEGFAKTWYKMFLAVIMIFPAVAMAMGGSKIAAKIVFDSAQESDDLIMMVIAAAMPAMGIALGLIVAKTMGSVMNRFGMTMPGKNLINSAKGGVGKLGSTGDRRMQTRALRKSRESGRTGGYRGLRGGGLRMRMQQTSERDQARLDEEQTRFTTRDPRMADLQGDTNTSRMITKATEDAAKYERDVELANKSDADLSRIADGDDEILKSLTQQRAAALNSAASVAGQQLSLKNTSASQLSTQLQRAVSESDAVMAKALTDRLANMGGAGADELRNAFANLDQAASINPGYVGSRAYETMTSTIANNGQVKGKAADVYAHAASGGYTKTGNTIIETGGSPGTWQGLSVNELASQTNSSADIGSTFITDDQRAALSVSDTARDGGNLGAKERFIHPYSPRRTP